MNKIIRRGDIWLADLNPTLGTEIQKIRPVIVLSVDGTGKLPLKLVAPLTSWKEAFENNLWHVQINPSKMNGLTNPSAADVLQLRGIDVVRCVRKLGVLEAAKLVELTKAVVGLIGYSAIET